MGKSRESNYRGNTHYACFFDRFKKNLSDSPRHGERLFAPALSILHSQPLNPVKSFLHDLGQVDEEPIRLANVG